MCGSEPECPLQPTHAMGSPDGETAANETGALSSSRANETYDRLRDLIVRGQLAPGSRIIETELSDRLEVSRTPVRSALQRLAQEGFIQVDSSSGGRSRPRVAPLTAEDAHELMYLLGSLEGLASRWTAELEREERLKVVDELRTLNERMEDEASDPERTAADVFFDVDAEFHRSLVEPGAGPRLLKLHRAYRPQAERYFRYYVSDQQYSLDRSLDEHREMIDAIGTGDPEIAEEAVERNWRNAEGRLQRAIELGGERGSW